MITVKTSGNLGSECPLVMDEGVTAVFTFSVKTDAGVAVDFTGGSATLTGKAYPSATTATLSLTEASGITLGNGTITVTIDHALLTGVAWTTLVYDLLVATSGGDKFKLLYGEISVRNSL